MDKEPLDVKTPTPEQVAKKHNVSLEYVMQQLKAGIEVEKEHTTHENVAREIALDHLGEKPNYYELLKKYVEKGLKENIDAMFEEFIGSDYPYQSMGNPMSVGGAYGHNTTPQNPVESKEPKTNFSKFRKKTETKTEASDADKNDTAGAVFGASKPQIGE